jgi:phosphohistidine phosphatase
MKLYLVQHGEACAKEVDPERPLTEQGKADVARLAGFLKQAGIRVDRVIHSGKLRAVQTAQILATAIAPGVELETSGIMNPNDNPKAFDWQDESWNRDTLLVGHLPFMAKKVSHLLVGDEARMVTAFQPGSMLCLEHVENSRWALNWMIRPDLLARPISNTGMIS